MAHDLMAQIGQVTTPQETLANFVFGPCVPLPPLPADLAQVRASVHAAMDRGCQACLEFVNAAEKDRPEARRRYAQLLLEALATVRKGSLADERETPTYTPLRAAGEFDRYEGSVLDIIYQLYGVPPPAADELRQLASDALKDDAAVNDLVSKVPAELPAQAEGHGAEPAPPPPAPVPTR
jgi:hypothetical protein